ncbi:MAG: Xaa-Pro peptidase family protein [Acidobacteria bacterium]|nr:Xaa-Pro peptidase family protein [Acidobacteriota bacterium]
MVQRVHFPKFSDQEYESRWQRIRDAMEARQFDCLLVYGAYCSFGSDPGEANLRYVTNFVDQFQAYCIFPKKGEATLATSYNGHISTGKEISVVQDIRFGGWKIDEKIVEILREKGMEKGRIGIVGVNSSKRVSIPLEQYACITRLLPEAEFEIATDLIENLRRVKSDEEIEFLRKGVKITDQSLEAYVKAIRPGARNIDLYDEILAETHRAGGTLCVALLGSTSMENPGMALPDAYMSDRPIAQGDVILSEHSSAYGGYSGQIMRTVFVGKPTRHYEKLFQIGLEVFERVRSSIRPGSTEKEVQEGAQPILDAGLTSKGPLLHGWGNFTEVPMMGLKGSVQPMQSYSFQKGNTVVIEPNPSTPDGKSGICLGGLCLVTENGAESLHGFPMDPILIDSF